MEVLRAMLQNGLLGLPPVRRLASRRHVTGIDGNPDRARQLFEFYDAMAPIRNARILELGPGKTLEVLDLAVEAGASRCAAADILRYHDPESARLRGIDYRVYDGSVLPFPDACFDLVWACYCLQHVREPERTVAEIERVLSPGGRLVCRVDLRDHYHPSEPGRQYDCLRHSERVWRWMAWNRGSYVNRLRASEWQQLFTREGLETERLIPHRDPGLLAQNRPHAYLSHLDDEDLLTFRFDGVYRKRPV